jgi:hypothetical protein
VSEGKGGWALNPGKIVIREDWSRERTPEKRLRRSDQRRERRIKRAQ